MLGYITFVVFITISWVMSLYSFNFYYLVYRSLKNRLRVRPVENGFPTVTVQLPIFNERYVAARLIQSVCAMDYPKDRLQIQVLDDSTDDTREICRNMVQQYKSQGYDIEHVTRKDRRGYKAGALKEGLKSAKGEFVAIFDADFVPPSWFFKKAMTSFSSERIGMVQCRWGHLNENYSALTQAQALSLDFHFLIEQKAKSLTHLFMNFNGTAGIWRRTCIDDAGGWHMNTLVEDLDLSYRAQMKGWRCMFLENVVCNAELPVQINAAKRQQYRWAKGSIQCAIKLAGDIVMHRKLQADTKIQAFIQLTRHIVHPLMLLQFLLLPLLLAMDFKLYPVSIYPITALVAYILFGPAFYIYVIKRLWQQSWMTKAKAYVYLILFATGISVNNTIGVFDAMNGGRPEFLRTPKFGITKKGEDWRDKSYALPFTKTTLLEMFFGAYGILGIFISIFSGNPIYVPILALQTLGFIYISYLSIVHSTFKNGHNTKPKSRSRDRRVVAKHYKAVMVGILGFLIFGVTMAYIGYSTTVYPLDKARGYVNAAKASSVPEEMLDYMASVKPLVPKEGNPVWAFPTAETDFGVMQKNIDGMMDRLRTLSTLPRDSEEFNTGLLDVREGLTWLEEAILEAQPYVYVSFQNVIMSAIWIGVLLMIFTVMKRGKERLQEFENFEGEEKI
ncbi:MAG: cellulose synthase/poly-beta-1,6-N-acetylglucosamine synthase-like glycosyltransferase [Candidatus Nitrosomirales archaeon]|jgi:cellulose synthase/poly-beta-1,6-N-acetylglucosamine synthase-like glycosyltransferase